MTGSTTTITAAEVDGAVVDVRIEGGSVTAVERDLPRAGSRVLDAAGAALLPGLHDHHLHLLAMAAADRSLDVGPAGTPTAFDATIRGAAVSATEVWLRVVGLDDRHGPLDRHRLDRIAPGARVRVQHRSGAAWVLSTAGLDAVGAPHGDGWVHRADTDLGSRWADDGPPDVAAVGRRLAALGVTGVTDATPFTDAGGFALLAAARESGDLPQRIAVTGAPGLAGDPVPAGLERGPVKVVVTDDALPSPEELVAAFRRARRAGRPVAVHCVTRVGLVLALTAWEEVGPVPGDRIEHGSVIPVELMAPLAALGLTVVTQPAFVRVRGDEYLAEVETDDVPHLYRCGSLLAAGIGVGGSTDAPFGPADPWLAMAVAVDRRTTGGAVLGLTEAVTPRRALDAFLSPLTAPGGPPRTVAPGSPADLCLLDAPLGEALATPANNHVRATWAAGRLVHGP